MQKLWFVFFLIISFSSHASISAKQVIDWVEAEGESSSVESVLEKLPPIYRSYFVLQYRSHSNHQASPLNPRVIFFGPDARLLFAFSGLPTDPHYNTIEMIEYEKESASFRFYSVHFQENKKAQIDVQPRQCQNCHGPDPKPNWEPYSLWPGAYGSLHDRVLKGTTEHKSFESFLASYLNSSRYRFLEGPFHVETKDFAGHSEYYLSNRMMGPGSALSALLSSLNQERIAKKLVLSPNHEQYRFAFLASLIGCQEPIDDFVPVFLKRRHPQAFAEVLTETRQLMKKDIARKLRLLSSELGVPKAFILKHWDLYGLRPLELIRISRLRYLLKMRTIDPIDFDRWALGISKTSLDFNDGIGGLQNLLGLYLPLAFEEDSPIRKSIQLRKVPFHFTDSSLDTFILESELGFTCHLLLKEAHSMRQ